eukprot:CCRYP_008457-RA/>CCRYP_008457-RA protein AED:0.26 eAED:0.26 QI:500/1/1/1/1/1/2/930/747
MPSLKTIASGALLLCLYNSSVANSDQFPAKIGIANSNKNNSSRNNNSESRTLESWRNKHDVHISRSSNDRNLAAICSCSPTVFNILVSFSSDPCSVDTLEDNSGIKGTLCLVGEAEGIDSGGGGQPSEGTSMAPSPTASTVNISGSPIAGSGSPVQVGSGIPTFSPTVNPTYKSSSGVTPATSVEGTVASSSTGTSASSIASSSSSTTASTMVSSVASSVASSSVSTTLSTTIATEDPFLPPAGALPTAPSSTLLPTYSPTTPFPTYGTYSPTISGTYSPTSSDGIGSGEGSSSTIDPNADGSDGPAITGNIDAVDGILNPTAQYTYYPTVDGTYAPTVGKKTKKEKKGGPADGEEGLQGEIGHDVASLIKRLKTINTPTHSYTYQPTTPFPTFGTYPPTDEQIYNKSRSKLMKREGKEETRRRLLEVINLDKLENDVPSIVEGWKSIPPNDEFFTRFPEWKARQVEIYRLRHEETYDSNNASRMLQASSLVPNQLLSAQFLEIDTSADMIIINQDDSYIDLIYPYNQDKITLSYTSISATLDPALPLEDQIDSVPGGAILVLIGQDENGEVVRNRLMWTYTMGCGVGVKTVENGDEFGWALFDDLQPAREEFCPASSATPAPSPSPTISEEKPSFSMDYNTMDYNRLLSHFDLEGKLQGKSPRNNTGRRSGHRKMKNSSPSTLVGMVDFNQKTAASKRESEFGRRVKIGERTEMTKSKQDAESIVEESAATEFGRQVKRLRRRTTA